MEKCRVEKNQKDKVVIGMKEYSVKDFMMTKFLGKATGNWKNADGSYCWGIKGDGEYSINYSHILSDLIRIAGRICVNYASDLFIDWSALMEELKGNPDYEGGIYLFGFRENGVDHTEFVLQRYNTGCSEEIKELYMLEVSVYESCDSIGNVSDLEIVMILGEAALKSEI